MADLDNFDMFKFGGLVNQVENLQIKVDKLEEGMEELLALANQSRGGFWAGMAIVSAFSTFVGFVTHYFMGK
jgi:hypothetical protein